MRFTLIAAFLTLSGAAHAQAIDEDPRPRLYHCVAPGLAPITLDFTKDRFSLGSADSRLNEGDLYFTATTPLGYEFVLDFGFTDRIHYGKPPAGFKGSYTIRKSGRVTPSKTIICAARFT